MTANKVQPDLLVACDDHEQGLHRHDSGLTQSAQQLIDSIASPVFIIEPDKAMQPIYTSLNKAALKMVEKEASDYLGRTSRDVYGGSLGALCYEKHQQTLQSGRSQCFEVHLPLNGKIMHLRTHLHPVVNDQGRVTRLVETSENTRAEHDLAETRSRSLTLSQELEHFINLAAHDLRSPMVKINALTDLIRQDFEDLGDGKLQALNLLEKVACSSLSMIEEIVIRANTVGIEESIERFNLASLCKDVQDMVDPQETHRVTTDSVDLLGDKIATQMVLRNLLDNSIKHNPDKTLSMQVSASAPHAGFFKISVSDNGQGIDNPHQLFTIDPAKALRGSFGLLGVSQLVRARGGVIFAESPTQQSGLRVTFTLPGEIISRQNANAKVA